MNKNLIITIVVIVALVGGAVFFMAGKSSKVATENANTTKQPAQQQNAAIPTAATVAAGKTVEYTQNGFVPSSVTIKSGETVTWTNKDTGDLWVASGPHPIHTDYPGFDALKGSPTGGTYSFTFTKVGTWKYHNHLKPGVKGTVVVSQ